MTAWRTYHITVTIRAPLAFVFRWCTDYRTEDGKYAGEDRSIHLRRKIVERRKRRVVFENIYDEGKGWGWERHVVTLRPPNRWHSEGHGNYQQSVLDYALEPISDTVTRFDMRWKSRPVGLSTGPRPRTGVVERYVEELWKRRARAIASEFRQSRGGA